MKFISALIIQIIYIVVASLFAYAAGDDIEAGDYSSAGPLIVTSFYFIAMVIKNSKQLEN